ncbi:hypothetical protein [Shimia sp. MIT910701]|uniref:hypothetical protein n=1 Tax=Shimia sp. MIT910701 TaxID=3096987 RepID=UPI0039997FC7
MEHPFGNSLDNPVDLARDLPQFPFGLGVIEGALRGQSVVFFLIGFDELSN